MNTKTNHYTPESLAKAEVKKARIAWRNANPENTQEVKESYNRLRMAELNYKRIMKLAK